MAVPNASDVLAGVEKGNVLVALVEDDQYVIYQKQYSRLDGTELVGEEQVSAVSLGQIDDEVALLQARIDAINGLREQLVNTKVTADEINAAADIKAKL